MVMGLSRADPAPDPPFSVAKMHMLKGISLEITSLLGFKGHSSIPVQSSPVFTDSLSTGNII